MGLIAKVPIERYQPPEPPEGACTFCYGDKRVEWTDANGNEGVYDPCPACEGSGKYEDMSEEWR